MPVRKIHGNWYIDVRHNGVRYRQKGPLNTRDGALAYEATVRRRLIEADEAAKLKAAMPTLAAFAEQWLDIYVKTNTKPSTQNSYRRSMAAQLLPRFGHLPIDEVSADGIKGFVQERLDEGVSPKTINNDLVVLSCCLRVAKEWDVLPMMPRIKLLRAPPAPVTPLSRDECSRLLGSIGNETVRSMVLCAIHTGMRIGELRGLMWEDVNLEHKQISVHRAIVQGRETCTKNYRIRYLPISQPLLEALEGRRRSSGHVFAGPDGRPFPLHAAIAGLKEGAERADIQHVHFHLLRHTFASLLANSGVDMYDLQKLMGHGDYETTSRYVHISWESMQRAVNMLAKAEAAAIERHRLDQLDHKDT